MSTQDQPASLSEKEVAARAVAAVQAANGLPALSPVPPTPGGGIQCVRTACSLFARGSADGKPAKTCAAFSASQQKETVRSSLRVGVHPSYHSFHLPVPLVSPSKVNRNARGVPARALALTASAPRFVQLDTSSMASHHHLRRLGRLRCVHTLDCLEASSRVKRDLG